MIWRKNNKIDFSYDKLWKGNIPKPRTDKGWGKSNKKLYDYIKDHYSIVQNDTCPYCRLPIRFSGYGEPVEHIFPKSLNSIWMYHPKNLCLSCYGCNTAKLAENTFRNTTNSYSKRYVDYPSSSTSFRIIHPHFDTFSKYIRIDKSLFCVPASAATNSKGSETIRICKLNRLECLYQRARLFKKNETEINRIAVQIIASPYSRKQEIDTAQKMVDELIKRASYFKKLKTAK